MDVDTAAIRVSDLITRCRAFETKLSSLVPGSADAYHALDVLQEMVDTHPRQVDKALQRVALMHKETGDRDTIRCPPPTE